MLHDDMVGIGKQGKSQPVFGYKIPVGGGAVGTDAHDFKTPFQPGRIMVIQVAGFGCTSRCIVFGIEIENQLFTPEIGNVTFCPSWPTPSNQGAGSPFFSVVMMLIVILFTNINHNCFPLDFCFLFPAGRFKINSGPTFARLLYL